MSQRHAQRLVILKQLYSALDNSCPLGGAIPTRGVRPFRRTPRDRQANRLCLLAMSIALAGCATNAGDSLPGHDGGRAGDGPGLGFVEGSVGDAPAARDAAVDQRPDAEQQDAAPPLTWDVHDKPLLIRADSAGVELLGFTQMEDVDELGTQAFVQVGHKTLLSSVFVAVDPAKRYRLSGRFRSVGATASRLYFGLAPYNADFEFISIEQSFQIGTAVTVSSFSDTVIVTEETISDWNSGTNPNTGKPYVAHQRSLGFYFDGVTNRLPDWLWTNYRDSGSSEVDEGTFSQASDTKILINDPVPAEQAARIIPATTKVMNHSSGGTYLYAAASAVDVPLTWTSYEGDITGASLGSNTNTFRLETAHVKLVLLLNYKQDNVSRIQFTELKFEELPAD